VVLPRLGRTANRNRTGFDSERHWSERNLQTHALPRSKSAGATQTVDSKPSPAHSQFEQAKTRAADVGNAYSLRLTCPEKDVSEAQGSWGDSDLLGLRFLWKKTEKKRNEKERRPPGKAGARHSSPLLAYASRHICGG
jgi:hypothetical protein